MEKWTMIVNPSSATAATEKKWIESRNLLIENGLEIDTLMTEKPRHAIELARNAAAGGSRKFIAAGGDGTIFEVMSGLLRYSDESGADLGEFTLGVLPYGTGNDWIKTSLIPKDLTQAAECIARGITAKEDVVRLTLENGTYCMSNIGGIGIDADICHYTNALKKKGYKGSLLYKLVAPYSIFAKKAQPVEITLDGEVAYSGKIFSAVIGNGIYRGGGIKQNQEGSSWSDGLLEVSIMPGSGYIKALQRMIHALSGDFAVQPGIITKRFRKMTVKPLSKHPDRVEMDGEIPGTLPLTIEATGQQINIIVP